jgi:hypothetical protein
MPRIPRPRAHIHPALNQIAPPKAPSSAPAKRRLPVDLLSDNSDSENVDPAALASPSKKSKNLDGTPSKVSKFFLTSTPQSSLNPPTKRKAVSYSVPATTNSTPIIHARGSDQRISLLKRRSLTPYRRQDPPLRASAAVPFSIDAALSGTISSYSTPAAKAIPTPSSSTLFATPSPAVKSARKGAAAPTSWFFAIHEDSLDQEATNLLQHGASVLDISSDDDGASTRAKDAAERGKENIPPPDSASSSAATATAATITRPAAASARRGAHRGISCPVKALKYEAAPDAMLEDRVALREMDVRAFWPAGADKEHVPEEPKVEAPKDAGEGEGIVVREDTPERVEV